MIVLWLTIGRPLSVPARSMDARTFDGRPIFVSGTIGQYRGSIFYVMGRILLSLFRFSQKLPLSSGSVPPTEPEDGDYSGSVLSGSVGGTTSNRRRCV